MNANGQILQKNRIEWVDNTKAFACFLVVLGHLLASLIKITPTYLISGIEYIKWFIYLFHMPLFMCISGYLYYKRSNKIKNFKQYKEFECKKFINLIIPYLVFYSITMILNMSFSSSVNTPKGINEWLGIINNPISPYWFIYALMSIFIVIPILEKLFNNNKIYIMVLFILLKILSLLVTTNVYFVDSIMRNGIFFFLGCFIKDNNDYPKKIVIMIIIFLYYIVSLFIYGNSGLMQDVIVVIMGLYGTIITISLFKQLRGNLFFDSYKKYTFQIFLMHTIFAAGVRILMLKIGIYNWYFHFIVGLTVSIYIPVLVSIISNKIKFTNFFFFPLKTIEEYKKGRILCQKKRN